MLREMVLCGANLMGVVVRERHLLRRFEEVLGLVGRSWGFL
jgi:hypothetical protein